MAKYPSMPLFTDAYMADTRHLTAAQHGAYLLLLMTAWRMPDCKLPDDDVFLSRCASMDLRTWKKNKAVVMTFWKVDEQQKFYQARLVDERNYVDELSSKNAEAGRASALKRKERDSTTVQPESNENSTPIPIPIPIPTITTPIVPLPDWLPKEAWQDLCDYRSKGKNKFTDKAKKLSISKLDKLRQAGNDPTEGINQTIMNGWTSLIEIKGGATNTRSNWLDEGDRLAEKYRKEAEDARQS